MQRKEFVQMAASGVLSTALARHYGNPGEAARVSVEAAEALADQLGLTAQADAAPAETPPKGGDISPAPNSDAGGQTQEPTAPGGGE